MQKTTRLKKPQVPEQEDWIVFDKIHNRPKYAGEEMTSETDIPSVSAETEARESADREIWTEIEAIEASSDVVDVVGTYAELQAYDTSKLHDKDLIKVLADETRDDAITYYRYSTSTETFTYVGAEGPYYTASETDTLLGAKQDTLVAGSNIQIAADGKTISATDTTYSDFTGATAQEAGAHGLVPAPTTSDPDNFLKGDGTWGRVASLETSTSPTTTGTFYDYYVQSASGQHRFGFDIEVNSNTGDVENAYLFLDDVYPAINILPAEMTQEKLIAGTNISIAADGKTISATDTTYSNFAGTDGTAAGTSGLVPAPATTDAGKFLKADGTWDSVASPINVVQAMGTSTTDVMSQDATTKLIYRDNAKNKILLGYSDVGSGRSNYVAINATGYNQDHFIGIGTNSSERAYVGSSGSATYGIAIGSGAVVDRGQGSISIGYHATTSNNGAGAGRNIAIGEYARVGDSSGGASHVSAGYSVALGAYSVVNAKGQVDISTLATTNTCGYNDSQYRLLSGLYPGQSDHDAATVGQVQAISIQYAGTPTTSTVGSVGQLYQDTTNGKLYICTAVNPGTAPDPDTYTWSEVGGVTVVQTTGQSTTAVMSQKAVTDVLGDIESALQILNSGAGVP